MKRILLAMGIVSVLSASPSGNAVSHMTTLGTCAALSLVTPS
jgi:hypothetical protein